MQTDHLGVNPPFCFEKKTEFPVPILYMCPPFHPFPVLDFNIIEVMPTSQQHHRSQGHFASDKHHMEQQNGQASTKCVCFEEAMEVMHMSSLHGNTVAIEMKTKNVWIATSMYLCVCWT